MQPAPATPRVSYVVAAYNHERFVARLVHSILEQTFADLEVVFVDDGSPDGTLAEARRAAGDDPRVRFVPQANAGVVRARNRGVKLARAPYVSIIDSDDILPPDRTRRMVEALDANPSAPFVYGDAWIVDDAEKRLGNFFANWPPPPGGDFAAKLFSTWCFVPACSVMFRREAFMRSGPFRGPGANIDYLKWIELALQGDPVELRDAKLGCWRWHDRNTSNPAIERRVRQYHELAEGLAGLWRDRRELRRRVSRRALNARLARCHFMSGFYAGQERRWDLARTEFARALRLSPSPLHLAALGSALPPVSLVSGLAYDIALRRTIGVRR